MAKKTSEIIEKWQEKLHEMDNFLEPLGGKSSRYRLHLKGGTIHFADTDENEIAQADFKILATYSTVDESFMASWSNAHLPDHVIVEKVEKVPKAVDEVSQDEATQYAMITAHELDFEFFFPAKTKRNIIYCGLNNLQEVTEGGESADVAEGIEKALDVLQKRYTDVNKGGDLLEVGERFMNSGEEIITLGQTLYEKTPIGDPMVKTGETLIYKGRELMSYSADYPNGMPKKLERKFLKEMDEDIENWYELQMDLEEGS